MPEATPSPTVVRFGAFEVDLRTGELRKQGLKIRLQERPFQILTFLLENRGEVVTREELRKRVWPADTFVDFDHSVNTAINKLREALGDSAENPHFIETLPRHGYRFIGAVDSGADDRNGRESVMPPARRASRRWLTVTAAAAIAVFGALFTLNVGGVRNRLLSSNGASHGVPLPKIESIAVLPFENLSGDPAQQYFADSMTDALITDLGRLSSLRVISRNSVMLYKGKRKPTPVIARELNVDGVVEGAVLRSGSRVRITAQLIDARADRHLWANSYEGELQDVLVLQDEVARAITQQIGFKAAQVGRGRMTRPRPVDPQAYEYYLKGSASMSNFRRWDIAAQYFQQAIEKDPGYAMAYATLATVYKNVGNFELLSPQESYPKAKAMAQRALELDNTLVSPHLQLAWSKVRFDWDWSGAEEEYRRALSLNPSSVSAHTWYAQFLGLMGRMDEAMAEIQQAQMLDPLDSFPSWERGNIFYGLRQYDQALEEVGKMIKTFRVEERSNDAHSLLGRLYRQKGMYKEAIAEFQKSYILLPECPLYLAWLGNAYGLAGKKAEALKIISQLKEQSKRKYISPYDYAMVYIGLGDKDQAFTWLEKAYQAHANEMSNLKVDPMLDSLRSDPRFQDILRRMNFPK